MASVRQTEYCCAIYEMGELDVPKDEAAGQWDNERWRPVEEPIREGEWWDRAIRDALSRSRDMGTQQTLPRIIMFADAVKSGRGGQWCYELQKRGYRVDVTDLGKNPKSGNQVEMFLWYPTKVRKATVKRSEGTKKRASIK